MAIFLNKAFIVEMTRREQSNLVSHKCPKKVPNTNKILNEPNKQNSVLTWNESANLFWHNTMPKDIKNCPQTLIAQAAPQLYRTEPSKIYSIKVTC